MQIQDDYYHNDGTRTRKWHRATVSRREEGRNEWCMSLKNTFQLPAKHVLFINSHARSSSVGKLLEIWRQS